MKKKTTDHKTLVRKRIAVFLAGILLLETFFPTASLALTSGPATPEFSSFEPVATTSMVNEFSGDFTYNLPVLNIPGPDGGGYALSLSYHGGESLESEASWVGYGWTLNPGSINRNKKGFADDTKSVHTFYNDVPKNWTASVGASIGDPEIFSADIPLTVNAGVRYNNYKGFGYTTGIGLKVKGIGSLGYSVSDGSGSFSAQINPAGILSAAKSAVSALRKKHNNHKKDKDPKFSKLKQKLAKAASFVANQASAYGMHSLADQQMPTSITAYNGSSFNVSLNLDIDPVMVPIGMTLGLTGNYTQQTNVPSAVHRGMGYMYSDEVFSGSGTSSYMMDYYTEKDSPFNKRDRYLSIPFSNADQFSVTGEGLSGGFRMHRKDVGRYRPNAIENKTWITQLALEGNLGFIIFGAGTDVGVGLQTLNSGGDSWGSIGGSAFNNYKFYDDGDEPFFFRYNGDLGGDVDFDPANRLVTATVSGYAANMSPGSGSKNEQMNRMVSSIDNTFDRSGRSSYIGYHTNGEMRQTSLSATGKVGRAYEKSTSTITNVGFNGYLDAFRDGHGEQIGEISSVNEDGNTYVYGLPVYSAHEKNMTYDMPGSASVVNRYLAYRSISSGNKIKVGTESPDAYATSYLLTQITTPDYVDRKMDGPTSDDFGGYTKFEYEKVCDVNGDHSLPAYHWRMPYKGFYYNGNDLSNPEDDMGSFSSGTKDVYYLKRIVTKSHIALFYTPENRKDGMDAADDNTGWDPSTPQQGGQKLKRLKQIKLYTNNNGSPGKLIKTVHFDYDYSLCENVPNNVNYATSNPDRGKLTLKKVWFEYEGIVTAKISPYLFDYTYPDPANYPFPYGTSSTSDYFGEYDAIIAAGATAQNPDYHPEDVDAWGNYQRNGGARFDKLQHHLDQKSYADFDPAAWQLKKITLPSGGEIHVQYEQDDYQYVQDQRACALISLAGGDDPRGNDFALNIPGDMGTFTSGELNEWKDKIKLELANDKIYFKFLYAMLGSSAALGQCNSEYISGYVDFEDAYVSGNTIRIVTSSSGSHSKPCHIGDDLVKKQKLGKINQGGNCDPADMVSDGSDAGAVVASMLSMFQTQIPNNTCQAMSFGDSYFRVPLLKAKKGGGLRVKRIMMYDANGVNEGKPALYGSEYIYKLDNGESSGVALNEPATIRDENPLISFLPKRKDQSLGNKAISGVDREQFEGPLGESILPAPSVGYSRVITKNIHSGKTNTGFVVSEFHTAREFPFNMSYDPQGANAFSGNGVENTDINDETYEKLWVNIPAVYVNTFINNTWATQGYRFIKNSMHGQPRSVSTYGGTYSAGAVTLSNKSSSTEYEYFKPGEKVKVMQGDGTVTESVPGKEMEIVNEARDVEDVTEDISTEFDASMSWIPPVVFTFWFSGSGTLSYAETKMRTYVTSKVIEFPAIQKSVTVMEDGITHKTENTVFSAYTGTPIQTVSTDGFDGKTLEQSASQNGHYVVNNIPGYTQYKELGQKAINERYRISAGPELSMSMQQTSLPTVVPVVFKLTLAPGSGGGSGVCTAARTLTIGDFVEIGQGSSRYYFYVDGINGADVMLQSAYNYNQNTYSSISAGAPLSYMEILRSGRTNQLKTMVGNYTVYGNSNSTIGFIGVFSSAQQLVNSINMGLASFLTYGSGTTTQIYGPGIGTTGILDGDCIVGYKMYIKKNNLGQFAIYTSGGSNGQLECQTQWYTYYPGSKLIFDPVDGKIKYVPGNLPCVAYEIDCFRLCDDAGLVPSITNVVSSSAITMNHVWPFAANVFDMTGAGQYNSEFETGAKGKWRTKSSYVYKTPTVGGSIENGTVHERVYKDAGTYSMTQFSWKNEALNIGTPWLLTSTATQYSPNGNVIEEKDAIDIYSTAKYGYNQLLPYLIAKNSDYASCFFESFENVYGPFSGNYYVEEKVQVGLTSISTSASHSGTASFSLGSWPISLAETKLTPLLNSAGASFKVWVKDSQRAAIPVSGSVVSGLVTIPVNYKRIAQTGEWVLYEAKVTNWSTIPLNDPISVVIKNNIAGQPNIYIDDFRMQPLNAQVTTYVYDKASLKLLTSFDDQHFGLYYQYNAEGKLVRKMIETEKGMKTIAETQYNTPKTVPTP